MTKFITDLDEIQRRAAAQQDDFEVLQHYLQFRDDLTDAEIDALVDQVAAPIIDAIDCTQCGNCCRALDVYLTPSDAQRLANGVDVPLEAIKTRYIDQERGQKHGEWGVFRERPCAFLDGKLCSVYEHRPETCRTYPAFTPDFRWTLQDTIGGAELCPIIYNVLVAMLEQAESL